MVHKNKQPNRVRIMAKQELENNILLNSEVLKELENGTDRAKVIVGATIIDTQLGRLLEKYLVQNNKLKKDALEFNGFLGTFSSKINACYLLGLISKNLFNDIQRLRKLRNNFAHNLLNCSLENKEMKDEVHKFKMVKDWMKTEWDKQPIAMVFNLEVAVIYVALTKKIVRIETIKELNYEINDLAFEDIDYDYLETNK